MKTHLFRLVKAALVMTLAGGALPAQAASKDVMPEPGAVSAPKIPAADAPGQSIVYQNSKKIMVLKNSRSLSGYPTADNKWKIRSGALIRSMALRDLTGKDAKMLADTYHVKEIIDFRSVNQQKQQPDVEVPGAVHTSLPVDGGQRSVDTDEKLLEAHWFNESSINDTYKNFFDDILKSNGTVLYHDITGGASVGFTTYLLMTALGMSQETRIDDYLLSRTYAGVSSYGPLYDYVQRLTRNGSVEAYMEKNLGVTPEKREALRAKYLISTDGQQTPYTPAASENTTKPGEADSKPGIPETPVPNPDGSEGNPEKPEVPEVPEVPTPNPGSTEKPDVIPAPNPEIPGVSTPDSGNSGEQPQPQPQPLLPTPFPPVTQPAQPQPARPGAKPRPRQRVKVLAVKRVSHGRYVFTKGHKPTYRDVHLKHRLTTTGKRSLKQWRIVRQAKLVVNGRRVTYLQLKPHHGSARWIAQPHIIESQR